MRTPLAFLRSSFRGGPISLSARKASSVILALSTNCCAFSASPATAGRLAPTQATTAISSTSTTPPSGLLRSFVLMALFLPFPLRHLDLLPQNLHLRCCLLPLCSRRLYRSRIFFRSFSYSCWVMAPE